MEISTSISPLLQALALSLQWGSTAIAHCSCGIIQPAPQISISLNSVLLGFWCPVSDFFINFKLTFQSASRSFNSAQIAKMNPLQKMQVSDAKQLFSKPWFLSKVLRLSSLQDLLLKLTLLNKTAHILISNEKFLLSFLKIVLRLDQKSEYLSSQEDKQEKQSVLSFPYRRDPKRILRLITECRGMKRVPPVQLFGYRSTLGHDHEFTNKFEVYNVGTGDFSKSYCSQKPGPGCISLIPYVYNNFQFQHKAEEYLKINQKEYQWYSSLYAPQQLVKLKQKIQNGELDAQLKEKILLNFSTLQKSKCQGTELEEAFNEWLSNAAEILLPVQELTKSEKHPIGQGGCGVVQDQYEISTAAQAMEGLQLLLFGFYLKLSHGYSCNLKNFAVVIHDEPLKVQESQLYSLVSQWKTKEKMYNDLQEEKSIKCGKSENNEAYFVQYFKPQSRSQKVRLVCWGETHQKIGDFYFSLPEVECTRYISIIGIDHHNHCNLPLEEANLDIRKFMAAGFLISSRL